MDENIIKMNSAYPVISVVIPVRNEASKIRDCIEGILSQSVPVAEIIVVDSGSTDGTIEILQSYGKVKLIQIPSSEFNHGETRNVGVSHATGEFVILTVGDARPCDTDWIKKLLQGFDEPAVAGVCGQQVVDSDPAKNPIDWFRPVSEPEIVKYKFTKKEFEALTPEQRKNVCGWDDVTAMYRLNILKKIPFQRTSYCEDAIWAKDALLAGYAIAYNPAARVYHYHQVDKDFTFKRSLTGMYFRYKHFGYVSLKPKRSLLDTLRVIKTIAKSGPLSLKEKWNWYVYNADQLKAAKKAYNIFSSSLAKGEQELEAQHEKFCGKPPVPLKATN